MKPPSKYARVLAGVAAAVLVISSAATAVAAPKDPAAPPAEPASTPVVYDLVEGQIYSYVLNARLLTPGQQMLVENAVADAGGVVVASWPQIGVVVAHSTHVNFEAQVMKVAKGNSVASIGLTRGAPVKEGTPEGSGKTTNGATGKGQQGFGDGEAVTPDPNEAVRQWNMRIIGAQDAHNITDGSADVLVGILDSGIDPNHPELVDRLNKEASVNCANAGAPDTSPTGYYYNNPHGVHVAGIIAASRNGVGIVGVAPNVKIAAIRVGNGDGYIYPEYAICGFVWAADHGVDVTNNSYFIDPFEYWCSDQPDQAAVKEAVTRAVNYATSKGVVSVAAAGNSATDLNYSTQARYKNTDTGSPSDAAKPTVRTLNSGCTSLPTELDGVVSVSSIAYNQTTGVISLSSFSNRGLGKIDVAAPGSTIYSTLPNNSYGNMSGTSMASPHVAGVLALMKSAHPDWTPAQMIVALRAEATPLPCPSNAIGGAACVGTTEQNSYYGFGLVNALGAVS